MKKILVFGAGRSSGSVIKYLLDHAEKDQYTVTVCDADEAAAVAKTGGHPRAKALKANVLDDIERSSLVEGHDLIVSMMPARFHDLIAGDCVIHKRHLMTASYISPYVQGLSDEVHRLGLVFIGEAGLDPGIDHMSAMYHIHDIQSRGGHITAFTSHTGGLVAPESDDNPWHYKISWNPRNVVTAGQSTAQYLSGGTMKFTPYNRLFTNPLPIDVSGIEGRYEVYPNRDSLKYIALYGLAGIETIMRGTIRYQGYCQAWDCLVRLGLTDDSNVIEKSSLLTYSQWVSGYIPGFGGNVVEETASFLGLNADDPKMELLNNLGIFSEDRIPNDRMSPAQILESLMVSRWVLKPEDKDLVIMRHEFVYQLDDKKYRRISTLIDKGINSEDTSMSKLVGLPLGITARLVLNGAITRRGVSIPVVRDIYEPVMAELEGLGIVFTDTESTL